MRPGANGANGAQETMRDDAMRSMTLDAYFDREEGAAWIRGDAPVFSLRPRRPRRRWVRALRKLVRAVGQRR